MAGYGGRGSFWGTDDEKISGWRFNHVMSSYRVTTHTWWRSFQWTGSSSRSRP